MNTHRHPHNASSSGGFLDTVRMLVKQKRIERVTASRPALILYTWCIHDPASISQKYG